MTANTRCPESSQEGARCFRSSGHEGNHFAKDAFSYYEWPRSFSANPRVSGECPMGCGKTLFLATAGHVTCSWAECPDPGAADGMLRNPGLLRTTEEALRERNARLERIERIARGEVDA